MSNGRRHQPTPSGANSSLSAPAPAFEPVSPLPRAAEAYVPPGSYGVGPHVPFTPYVPPLPPKIDEHSPASALRVVTEDPLAFLAAQAAAHPAASDELPAPAPAPAPAPTRRFRAADGTEAPRPRDPRRGSVPPPGFR